MSEFSFEAVIFDLDGVITQTARVHSLAWKKMFDSYLELREEKYGEPFTEFNHAKDYLPYVDGKPRYKGVESFLSSRGITIEWGNSNDSPDTKTVCGLGNKKNSNFNEILIKDGAEVYESTVNIIKELKQCNIKIAVASSSKNCKPVLKAAGLFELFETLVDGVISSELNLKGKPEPDIFTTACDNLQIDYKKAIIVEDAVSGVKAGAKGGFGFVLGIARKNNKYDLLKNGADRVISDFSEINITDLEKWFQLNIKNQD